MKGKRNRMEWDKAKEVIGRMMRGKVVERR